MSHKSGHIIINIVSPLPSVNESQREKLTEIQTRDEYTAGDRMYLGYIVALVADDLVAD